MIYLFNRISIAVHFVYFSLQVSHFAKWFVQMRSGDRSKKIRHFCSNRTYWIVGCGEILHFWGREGSLGGSLVGSLDGSLDDSLDGRLVCSIVGSFDGIERSIVS